MGYEKERSLSYYFNLIINDAMYLAHYLLDLVFSSHQQKSFYSSQAFQVSLVSLE